STARPIDEHVTRMNSAPACSADRTWPTSRRAVGGGQHWSRMMSHNRLSSTMLNTVAPRSNSSASVLKTGTIVGEVWMKAIVLGIRRSILHKPEKIDRPDLPAFEC